MRTYTCAKTVELPLTKVGYNYFEDWQDLHGKRIVAVNVCPGAVPFEGQAMTADELRNCTLNLTSDGQFYKIFGESLEHFDYTKCKGVNQSVDMNLSVMNCFVDTCGNDYTGKTVILVIWYQYDLFTKHINNPLAYDSYDNFETRIATYTDRNYLPDNRALYGKSFRYLLLSHPVYTPNYNRTLPAAYDNVLRLSLCKGSNFVLERVPLCLFNQSDWFAEQRFDDIVFDFDNSWIESTTHDSGVVRQDDLGKYILFTCGYAR